MSNQKYFLIDKKYGLEQFDSINWNGGPGINTMYALDRMPVSIAWGLNIDIHPTFAEQLGIQVSREVERILGVKGLQKWEICIDLFGESRHINEGKPINFGGYSYFYLRIVTKNLLYPNNIWIRWKSLKEGVSYIALNDEVSTETIKFEICEEMSCSLIDFMFKFPTVKWAYDFPTPPTTESINSWKQTLPKELHPLKKRKKEKTGYRFDVEIFNPGWPDVFLEITLDKAAKDNVMDCIQEYINHWNDESESKKREQCIHYANVIDSTEDGHITVTIDFGSCNPPKPLNKLFEWLSNSRIPINLITVK